MVLSPSNFGLTLFALVVWLNCSGLLFDLLSHRSGLGTVSQLARDSWVISISIVSIQLIGIYGLALHFWGNDH